MPFGFFQPQPVTREKSFPVPKGIIPIGTFSKFILYRSISSTIQIMVPSPPPMTILIRI